MKNLENKTIIITGASYVNGQTIAIDGGESNSYGNA